MPDSRFCPNCGRSLEPADQFCVACGVSIPKTPQYPAAPVTPYPGARVAGGSAEYAGFWRRFAAFFVDSIICGVVSYGLQRTMGPLGSLLGAVGQWLYFALMESSELQATLGKMALGVVVTDGQGNRIGFGRATGRYFAKIVSGLILFIGYMMAGWTARKQALHDIMADCLVICKGSNW